MPAQASCVTFRKETPGNDRLVGTEHGIGDDQVQSARRRVEMKVYGVPQDSPPKIISID
jgi:hypothetical protein